MGSQIKARSPPGKKRPRSSLSRSPKSPLSSKSPHSSSSYLHHSSSSLSSCLSSEPSHNSSSSTAPIPDHVETKRSWVWAHFHTVTTNGVKKHLCQAQLPTGDRCNTPMQPDKTGSTKALSRHLNRRHHIFQGTDVDSGIMQNFLERGKIIHVSMEIL